MNKLNGKLLTLTACTVAEILQNFEKLITGDSETYLVPYNSKEKTEYDKLYEKMLSLTDKKDEWGHISTSSRNVMVVIRALKLSQQLNSQDVSIDISVILESPSSYAVFVKLLPEHDKQL